MPSLAENPQKRKGLLILGIGLLASLAIVVGIGLAMHWMNRETPHYAEPIQTENIAPASAH